MPLLDTIFTAYFSVVPYALLEGLMTGVIIFELIFVFVSRWDLL
jgi:hypothetical protein